MEPVTYDSAAQMMLTLKTMVSFELLIITIAITEFLKIYVPDDKEGKIVPVAAVVICVLLSFIPAFNVPVLNAVVTGVCAPGLYAVAMKIIKKFKEQNDK